MSPVEPPLTAERVKELARAEGFELAGIVARPQTQQSKEAFEQALKRYSSWLALGYDADMAYLARHLPLKSDPEKLLPDWKSVLCVGLAYGTPEKSTTDQPPDQPRISCYTSHDDYHEVMAEKLRSLQAKLKDAHGIESFVFVDAQPVLDRFWAAQAGLGWIGRNTCLIHRKLGSYLFLGGLITTAELESDSPYPDHCGKCRRCIEACPTHAIVNLDGGFAIDSRKCIAYHTIENKGAVPDDIAAKTGTWIAGCDICQAVCPWNDPPAKPSPLFVRINPARGLSFDELTAWSAADFKARLRGIAMGRMKYKGFLRNLAIAISNARMDADRKQTLLDRIEASRKGLGDG